jgi:hypothetical protein
VSSELAREAQRLSVALDATIARAERAEAQLPDRATIDGALQALIAARPYVLAAASTGIVLELEQLREEVCRQVLDDLDGAIGGLQGLLA